MMKRTKVRKADLILTSDWHIRETIPECRTDDFEETLWKKLEFIEQLQTQHGCPILVGGDIFHHWKPSPGLIRKAILNMPFAVHTIYGQHDLPQHNWQNRDKSGLAALDAARALFILPNCHWGQDPEVEKYPSYEVEGRQILVWHHMVWQGRHPWPGCTDPSTVAVLRKYPEYDLILTGDNHKPFIEEYEGRILVNPGSLTRQTADQIDHLPRVYLYDADSNTVQPVYLPIQKGDEVISREHIDKNKERTGRIQAFISKLGEEWASTLSFEKNLEEFFKTNRQIRTSVKNNVYESIERDSRDY